MGNRRRISDGGWRFHGNAVIIGRKYRCTEWSWTEHFFVFLLFIISVNRFFSLLPQMFLDVVVSMCKPILLCLWTGITQNICMPVLKYSIAVCDPVCFRGDLLLQTPIVRKSSVKNTRRCVAVGTRWSIHRIKLLFKFVFINVFYFLNSVKMKRNKLLCCCLQAAVVI